MSISKNVGGLSKFLKDVRLSHYYATASKKYKNFLSNTGTLEVFGNTVAADLADIYSTGSCGLAADKTFIGIFC